MEEDIEEEEEVEGTALVPSPAAVSTRAANKVQCYALTCILQIVTAEDWSYLSFFNDC